MKNALPLVRYCVQDRGKIYSFAKVERILSDFGYNYRILLADLGWDWKKTRKLPLLLLYGRADDTIIFNGTNIYQKNMEPALYENLELGFVNDYRLAVDFEEKAAEPRLIVHVELREGITLDDKQKKDLKPVCAGLSREQFIKNNIDFAAEYESHPEDCQIEVSFHPYCQGLFSTKSRKNL